MRPGMVSQYMSEQGLHGAISSPLLAEGAEIGVAPAQDWGVCGMRRLRRGGGGVRGKGVDGGFVVGRCVGVWGCGYRVGPVWGVRGVVQDRMADEGAQEVFDPVSGGMFLAMCKKYKTSFWVEGIKAWHLSSGTR